MQPENSIMPKIPFWVFVVVALIYFTSVRVDTMDIDASQYASMSAEMLKSHNWLFLFDHGQNYLDKPPLLFWISALSMKIFGVNNFGYKLPSLLFALWAIYATYRLAKLLYHDATARMAALILASCQGMFLMTNDIRCDTLLMSWVVTSLWLIKAWDVNRKLLYLLGGFAAIGFGMLTKGPIALMVPVFCFATDWALKRKWRKFFHPGYLLGLVIVAIVLLPMSIGLYQQYDLHPEALVNGHAGVSGLRFFYWSQSFGRITGESPWTNGADLSFLLVNMLWSFLPWIFVFVPALVLNVAGIVKQRFRLAEHQEWISTGGFLLSYLALGSSHYQLPHYIFVAFPLAAIITASSIARFLESGAHPKLYAVLKHILTWITGLIIAVVLLLISYVFPSGWLAVVLWVGGVALWCFVEFGKQIKGKFFWLPAAGIIIANVFVTNCMYYNLLQYQVGSQVGRYLYENNIASRDFIHFQVEDPLNSLSFYARDIMFWSDSLEVIKAHKYVLTMDTGLGRMTHAGIEYDIIKQGKLFKVSELTPEFLNPATRPHALKNYYLVKLR